MISLTTLLAVCGLASATVIPPPKNPTPETYEYFLKTKVTGLSTGFERFNNLYLDAFHYGAGLNDPVFSANKSNAIRGYLAGVNDATGPFGHYGVYHQLFDMGATTSNLQVEYTYDANSAWQPVKIFAGEGNKNDTTQSFFSNSQGLRWTTQPGKPGTEDRFQGWLICDWWHLEPQLFVELNGYGAVPTPIPSSCARVDLLFEYTGTQAPKVSPE